MMGKIKENEQAERRQARRKQFRIVVASVLLLMKALLY